MGEITSMANFNIESLLKYIPLIETLRTYRKEYLNRDLVSAMTVAVIANLDKTNFYRKIHRQHIKGED